MFQPTIIVKDEESSPKKRFKRIFWIAAAIAFDILLAASAVVISDRLKKEKYVPPEEVPARVELVCKNPSDVVLVIDLSGSMLLGGSNPPQPITDAKNAAKTFVEAINVTSDLEKTDRIAIVSYGDAATLNLGLGGDTSAINSAIDNLTARPEGWTNIGGGIKTAFGELDSNGRSNASKAIIVLSDGVANIDPNGQRCEEWPIAHNDCTRYAINQAGMAKDAGVSIYTIGLNIDGLEGSYPGVGVLAEDTLKQSASGEENYFAAPDSSGLENIYRAIAERVCDLGLISGSVFNDWDQDGDWDDSEPSLAGWTLTLTGGEQPQTVTVDSEGNYAFTNLLPGSYTLSINAQAGWIQTLAPEASFSLAEGQSMGDLDFAFYDPNATHRVCQNNSCVAVSGGGVDECSTDSECLVPSHKECVDQKCVSVDGGGADGCSADLECIVSPASHKECVGQKCVSVDGAGTDKCATDSECVSQPTPTHKTCVSNRCLVVSGAGPDSCSIDANCTYEAPRVRKVCSGGRCVEVPGEGNSECISDSECAAKTSQTHRACQNSLCVAVSGVGVDECVHAWECVSSTPGGVGGGGGSSGQTASTPSSASQTATSAAVPATAWVVPTLVIFVISLGLVLLGIAI